MTARIRLAEPTDAQALAEIYRPIVESTPITFEIVAPDAEEMARRLDDTQPAYPWLVCERDGEVAGYAYATRHRARWGYQWSVEVSVYTDPRHWRAGVGRGLYTSLHAILAVQGFVNAYAVIALPNPASVALHESIGFTPFAVYPNVGYKFDRWHDVGWWQLTLTPHQPSPTPPLDMATVQRHAEWDALVASGESLIRG